MVIKWEWTIGLWCDGVFLDWVWPMGLCYQEELFVYIGVMLDDGE